MYFMPKTNKWYSWAVHTKATYRYSLTFLITAILLAGWWFGIRPWFEASIHTEQALMRQHQQQLQNLLHAERSLNELKETLPLLRKEYNDLCPTSPALWHQQQVDCMMMLAEKAGVQVNSYTKDTGNKKSWGSYDRVHLTIQGTYAQIIQFLTSLSQSHYMIACCDFRAQRNEGDLCTASCGLRFIRGHQ